MRCSSFCIANALDLTAIQRYLKQTNQNYEFFGDVIYFPFNHSHIFYFKNGTIVIWNLNKGRSRAILEQAKHFAIQPAQIIEQDDFTYHIADVTDIKPHRYFNVDIIYLQEDTDELKLAMSYGLSQSIKLALYERNIQLLIDDHAGLSHELAESGRIKLPRRAITKMLGRIFVTKSLVNLKSEYLNIPKYFWQHPGLEQYYQLVDHYLDIPRRVASLNQKLDILNELLAMLTSQLQHQHSSFLEIVIIVLIAAEIFFSFVHLV